jgi:hypothetical protein
MIQEVIMYQDLDFKLYLDTTTHCYAHSKFHLSAFKRSGCASVYLYKFYYA